MKSYALFKVGSIWHYRFRVDGQRIQRSTGETLRIIADRVAYDAFEAAKLRARGEEPCPTVRGLVALWLAAQPITTSRAYLKTVETFGRLHLYELAELRLGQVGTSQVEEARALHLQDHAPASGNHWLNILKMLFNWAISRRMIQLREWKVKQLRFQRRPRTILSPSDQVAWLKAVDKVATKPMAIIIRLALGTGLREMECATARWEWFDWTDQIYRVGKAKDMEPRAIPMHPVFRRVMRTRWLYQGKPHQGLALKTKKGEPHFAGYLKKPVANTARRMKIVGLHPHWLRASAATAWWESGASIAKIMLWLGHEDAATTMLYIVKRDLDGRQIQVRAAQAGGWPVPVESPEKKPESPKRRKKAA